MIKVFIDYKDYGSRTGIIILAERGDGRREQLIFGKPSRKDVTDTMIEEASIELPAGLLGNEILQALTEALSKSGIKTENDHQIKGLLEATQSHLKDMRSLVFLQADIARKNAGIDGQSASPA